MWGTCTSATIRKGLEVASGDNIIRDIMVQAKTGVRHLIPIAFAEEPADCAYIKAIKAETADEDGEVDEGSGVDGDGVEVGGEAERAPEQAQEDRKPRGF